MKVIVDMNNRKRLVGKGINAAYRRTPLEWMQLIINCLIELQDIINDMEKMNTDDTKFIIMNVQNIKRFYEELEREFFRSQLAQASSSKVQSNISIHF